MHDSTALITSLGILYQNNYYTCSRAISEQWFDHMSPYYMLEVQIQNEDNLLSIVLDTGELLSVITISTSKNYPQYDLEQYFTKLNQLKIVKKNTKKEKS